MINIHSTDIPVVVETKPPSTNRNGFFIIVAYVSQSLIHVVNIVAPLCQIWANYYARVVVFGEQGGGIIMPRSALTFIINALLAFAEIKSQGQPGFPFHTHPRSTMFSVSSVMMYGLASAAERVITAAGFDHTSVYAVIARLGRLGALFILVVCLSYLFYV